MGVGKLPLTHKTASQHAETSNISHKIGFKIFVFLCLCQPFAPNATVLSVHESGSTLEILKMLSGENQCRQNQDLGEKGHSV